MPVLDRDEARFAQATAQMLETGDFIDIRFQDQPRDKKPVGIHWMQAAAVATVSSPEARAIWVYRLPSLLAAMAAAAACAWGAAALFGPARGLAAGALLGASTLLSTEAGIAKTDAVLCAATTLAMAALARIYVASRGGGDPARPAPGWRTAMLMWLGMAVAVLDKGPIAPMVAGLAGLSLWAVDRGAPWTRRLYWLWGGILVLAVVGPWAMAITVRTDGAFWGHAIGGDVAPKLRGGQEGHGAPPGIHSLLAPLLFFPAAAFLPLALIQGWKARAEPGVRFALAWLVPSWIFFEAVPTKLPHYPLPLYAALAWLAVAGLDRPLGAASRRWGVAAGLLGGLAWIALPLYVAFRFGDRASLGWAALAALLAALAGLAAIRAVILAELRARWVAVAAAVGLGLAAHGVVAGAVVPGLSPLWVSRKIVSALQAAHLDPRDGLAEGPVTVIGYAEPSLVFALGTETELGDVGDGGEAIRQGRPVVVEARSEKAFLQDLSAEGLAARPVGAVTGFDYSSGKKDHLILYQSSAPTPGAPAAVRPPSQAKEASR